MKKLLIILLIVAAAFYAVDRYEAQRDQKNREQDYETVEALFSAMDQVLPKYVESFFGEEKQEDITISLEDAMKSDNELCKLLREKLPEDFSPTLTNGDALIIKATSRNILYQIYADNMQTYSNMLYPEWNYAKLPKPEEE